MNRALLATCLSGALAAACGHVASSPRDEDAGAVDGGADVIAVDGGADVGTADGADAGQPPTQRGDGGHDDAGVDGATDGASDCGARILEVSCTRKDASSDLLVRIWHCGMWVRDAAITQTKPFAVDRALGDIALLPSGHFFSYHSAYDVDTDAGAVASGYPWYLDLQTYEPAGGIVETEDATRFSVSAPAADGGKDVLVTADDLVCVYTGQ